MRRSRNEITFEILKEIQNGTHTPTRILNAVNASWTVFRPLLDKLILKGFAREKTICSTTRSTKQYYITDSGVDALNAYISNRKLSGQSIQKWVLNINEIKWVLELLGFEQTDFECSVLSALLTTPEPFTGTWLARRLELGNPRVHKLIKRFKDMSIITTYTIEKPEDWENLTAGDRSRRVKQLGVPRGWHRANYLIVEREHFREVIKEAVRIRMDKLLKPVQEGNK